MYHVNLPNEVCVSDFTLRVGDVLKYYVTEGQRRLEVRSNGDGQNVSLDLYSGRLR